MKRGIVALISVLIGLMTMACTTQKGETDMITEAPGQSNSGIEATSAPASSVLITAEEAKKRLDSGESIVLLDVRTEEEYLEKHIPGSLLIPLSELEKDIESKLPDKNATLFVYCRSGNRSATASKILVELGYTNVYDLGGIMDWPYDTESGQ